MSVANDAGFRKRFIGRVWAGERPVGVRFYFSALLAASSLSFLVGAFEGASAQSRVTLSDNADLRALYANANDIAQGKRLVEATCGACHGVNGISTVQGVPNLAAQRPAYLYLELNNYRAGIRSASVMNDIIKPLNDDALFQAAAYFSSLAPPQISATKGSIGSAPDPLETGKTAAAACGGCHGEAGVSKTAGIPSLVGLDPKYFVAAVKAYKNGQRKNDLMKSMVAGVSDATLTNIALYYALEKASRAQTSTPGNTTAGASAAATCAGCHGANGVSGSSDIPSLAGQDMDYLATAFKAYRDGTRTQETMKGLAATVDDNAIKALAVFYAAQEPKQPNVLKPLTVEEWSQRCDRCHGVNGNSVDPRLPALAGQRMEYLDKVLHDYRTGLRKSPQMAAMSDVLTDQDIANLAAFYARQSPRAVVYVMVPSK